MAEIKTLDRRLEEARDLRKLGYNCSQTVAMVFDDITSEYIDRRTLASLVGGLGGGVAGLREICGAVSAMASVESLLDFHSPADKAPVYGYIQEMADEFQQENGSLICRDLKTVYRKPCMKLIEDAIAILHNRILSRLSSLPSSSPV